MNIVIDNKRITITSVPYNKTLDFTKARFDHTTMCIENDAFDFAFASVSNTVNVILNINDVEISSENLENATDIIASLKNCLKQVDFFFKQLGSAGSSTGAINQNYEGQGCTVVMTQGMTAPSPLPQNIDPNAPGYSRYHTYSWNKTGNLVTLVLRLNFKFNGIAVSELVAHIPADVPLPKNTDNTIDAYTEVSAILTVGNGNWGDTNTNVGLAYVYIINTGTRDAAIRINHTPENTEFYQITVQYFTEE